ncbi:glycosyltransferase [Litoribacter ruber]|uniref:glycosyltransferase n=1 Tax=Litoribacter ruber TaxID=702568 RepID=UPI001BD93589|nr:glycosyltransferase [Litoribacter ruber]MBT0811307.1 glycosyltransferase [Litoribacter ruber]
MMWGAQVIVFFLLVQDLVLYLCMVFNFKDYFGKTPASWPNITVLIPARNEEDNIKACLEALEQLDYPSENLQVILGNDGSEDHTEELMKTWQSTQSHCLFLNINEAPANSTMTGKANALNQMAKLADGEYLLFTDADCKVGAGWAKEMVGAAVQADASLVTGITAVEGRQLFGKLQAMDWWLTLGMVKVFADLNTKVTSMGNNMLIKKSLYEKLGGFEKLPFSVTEDFELAKAVSQLGYRSIHQVSQNSLLETKPVADYWGLLRQRKRWMRGAMGLTLIWKVLLALQVLFFPSIIFLTWLNPLLGVGIWAMKIFIQSLFLRHFAGKTQRHLAVGNLLLFEFYYLFISWSTIVYYFWPAKINWKGRTYPVYHPK